MTAIDERARVYADRDWWRSAGNILGLELRGWTFRNEASFADRETGRRVEMPGWLAERILQALRPGSTGETEGWVLVPKEPTMKMLESGMAAMRVALSDGLPRDQRQAAGYRAMLAAAGGRDE